VSISLLTLRF